MEKLNGQTLPTYSPASASVLVGVLLLVRVFSGIIPFMLDTLPKQSRRSPGSMILDCLGLGMTILPRYSDRTLISLSR